MGKNFKSKDLKDLEKRHKRMTGKPKWERETCEGKRQYGSRAIAKIAASKIRKFRDSIQKPYKCKVCRFYHLTTVKETDEGS